MNNRILNRVAAKRRIAIAMITAVAIHLSAVAIASFRHERAAPITDPSSVVIGIDDPDRDNPPPPEIPVAPETQKQPTEFAETPFPATVPLGKPAPIRRRNVQANANYSAGNFKALPIRAPRPAYPYEARQRGLTGNGVVILTVDPGSGVVIDAQVEQSIGSPILDSAALYAFRQWRFKPGAPAKIRIPITFSLLGVRF
ncbi:MAG: energy transducer TonB [Chthoniobacterales bacterium]